MYNTIRYTHGSRQVSERVKINKEQRAIKYYIIIMITYLESSEHSVF